MGIVHEGWLVGLTDRFEPNADCDGLLTLILGMVSLFHAAPFFISGTAVSARQLAYGLID